MKKENDDELPVDVQEPACEQVEAATEEPAAETETEQDDSELAKEPVPEPAGVPEAEVELLVAEAEARGYQRGRNEAMSAGMHTPRLWENSCRTAMEREQEPDAAMGFLSKMRPSVWD